MTEPGTERRSVCKHCGSGVSRANVRENTYECPTHGVISGASVLYVEDDGLRADGSGDPGSVRFWDHEDCPRDDCGGDLQQQDRFNVQCLSCESVFTHCRRSDRHWLEDLSGEIVAQKTLVTDGGTEQTGIEHWTGQVHQGDAAETLAEMPESSVHCVVTSPPYFGLRDYGVDGQIGAESSVDEFVASIVEVADEIRRVLRPDGVFWLNLGDSYDGRKCKNFVPHRVAIALIEDGWIARQDNIWAKEDPLPNPTDDRHATTKEYIFHLTPGQDYWCDLDPIRESPKQSSIERATRDGEARGGKSETGLPEQTGLNTNRLHPNGKNPGDVWRFSTCNFPDAHFAVFPRELPEPPIKATCPPQVCAKCGAPYEREKEEIPAWERDRSTIEREQLLRALDLFEDSDLTEEHLEAVRSVGFSDAGHGQEQSGHGRNLDRVEQLADEAKDVLGGYFREMTMTVVETKGWKPGCGCETDETAPGIVLDPFAGAGTTLLVGKELGRRFVGIDLNPEYVEMARHRVGLDVDEPTEFLDDEDQQTLSLATDGGDENCAVDTETDRTEADSQ